MLKEGNAFPVEGSVYAKDLGQEKHSTFKKLRGGKVVRVERG